eukprot:gene24118-30426_t
MPEIVDFTEIDLEQFISFNQNKNKKYRHDTHGNSEESSSKSPNGADSTIEDDGTETTPSMRPLSRLISFRQFSTRINKLEERKLWVEKAARRSSIGFHPDRTPTNDKESMDRFLVALTKGTHIRRHQSGYLAETVRLFSVTGCREIRWEKPHARDLLRQKKRDGLADEKRGDAMQGNKHEKSIFDYCVAICGCGDDLAAGNDRHQEPTININDDEDEARKGVGIGKWFHNFGYQRSGMFRELDILAVQAANRDDPTALGETGTESLRRSKDTFNAELTFSVIVRDMHSEAHYSCLDIECDTADTYFLLLKGFVLLQNEADRLREIEDPRHSSRLNQQIGGAVSLVSEASSKVLTSLRVKTATVDPISDLFRAENKIDPLRALHVGGGLFTASHQTHSDHSPQKQGHEAVPGSPATFLPPARFLGWNSAGTQIWARLRMAGLEVKCVFSWDLQRVLLKIRCPAWRLEEMAEQMHIKLKSRDGYLKQFKVSRRDTFIPLGSSGTIFRSSERQQIIDYIIRSKIIEGGAELDENTQLGRQIVQRFPLHMQSRLQDIRHSWVTFWRRERPGESSVGWSPFDEKYSTTYSHLKQSVAHVFNNLLTQPLDNVAEYFGEGIAFYFAYMAFYTRWLVFPSVLGFIVFCVQCSSRRLDIWLCTPFSVAVTVWACFMLAFWRQKAAALAYRWGVLDYEIEETERPQFIGSDTYDESSGEVRKTYSVWRRLRTYLFSIPVIAACILCVLLIMTTIFTTQTIRSEQYAQKQDTSYKPVLPTKLGLFVTVFTSLYYYAFFMTDREGAFTRMSVTIFSLMTVGQWWGVVMDLWLPSLKYQILLYQMRGNVAATSRKIYRAREYTDSHRHLTNKQQLLNKLDKRVLYLQQGKSQCWTEALHEKYNNFSDYTNMVIQIGFVLCFCGVFPLAPLLALINNLALIRFNAHKICSLRQRPIASKVAGLAVWEDVLQVMSVGGVLTNCAVMGITSTTLTTHLHAIGGVGLALLLFGYEQCILLFKYWLHSSIPRVPPTVQRAQFRERKSIDRKSLLRNKTGHKQKQSKPLRAASYCDMNYGDNGDDAWGGGPDNREGGMVSETSPAGGEQNNQLLSATTVVPFGRRGSAMGNVVEVPANRRVSFNAISPRNNMSAVSNHPLQQSEQEESEWSENDDSSAPSDNEDEEEENSDTEYLQSQSPLGEGDEDDQTEEWMSPPSDEEVEDGEEEEESPDETHRLYTPPQTSEKSPRNNAARSVSPVNSPRSQRRTSQTASPRHAQQGSHFTFTPDHIQQQSPYQLSQSPYNFNPNVAYNSPQNYQHNQQYHSPHYQHQQYNSQHNPHYNQHHQQSPGPQYHTPVSPRAAAAADPWEVAFSPDSADYNPGSVHQQSPYRAQSPYGLSSQQQMTMQQHQQHEVRHQSPSRSPVQKGPAAKVVSQKVPVVAPVAASKPTKPQVAAPQSTSTVGLVSQWLWPIGGNKQNTKPSHGMLNIAPLGSNQKQGHNALNIAPLESRHPNRSSGVDIEMGPFSPPSKESRPKAHTAAVVQQPTGAVHHHLNSTAEKIRKTANKKKVVKQQAPVEVVTPSKKQRAVDTSRAPSRPPLVDHSGYHSPTPSVSKHQGSDSASNMAERWKQGITTNSTRHLFPPPASSPFSPLEHKSFQQQQHQEEYQQQHQQEQTQWAQFRANGQHFRAESDTENQRNRGNVMINKQQQHQQKQKQKAPRMQLVVEQAQQVSQESEQRARSKKSLSSAVSGGEQQKEWRLSQQNPFSGILTKGPERVQFD